MSFTFHWPRFSDQFHHDAIQMLNKALNKGKKPPVIADRIEVVELEMGTQSPELEIRDIGDLTVDQFRGIFRFTYSGDAHLVLKTKVQANPLNQKQQDIHLVTGSVGMLAAKEPLVVPMLLRLSHFKLNSYVVLVVSKQKGITLVFKTDPLQNVDINSTFDSIAVIQKFIKREIEGQLRQMFREDLPGIIHRLSQQWVKAKVEAPYLTKSQPSPAMINRPISSSVPFEASFRGIPLPSPRNGSLQLPHGPNYSTQSASPKRPRSISGYSTASTSRHKFQRTPPPAAAPLDLFTFPDLENFDPTYGLRPEGLPAKSLFRGFSSLFTPNRGLADLAEDDEEEQQQEYDFDTASFDIINWEYTSPSDPRPHDEVRENPPPQSELETMPAVGGGTITRPRIYHSQSMIHPSPGTQPHGSQSSSSTHRAPSRHYPSLMSSRSGFTTPNVPEYTRPHQHTPSTAWSSSQSYTTTPHTALPFARPRRSHTPDSSETQPSGSSSGRGLSASTPPTEHPFHDDYSSHDFKHDHYSRPPRPPALTISVVSPRSPSISAASAMDAGFPPSSPPTRFADYDLSSSPPATHQDPQIVLRPSLNNSIHKLSTLSHSNHTLSPYTRTLNHFTVRSVPPRTSVPLAAHAGPVKAKRKRILRLGGVSAKGKIPSVEKMRPLPPPPPPGEAGFDLSDMDRYFRTYSEFELAPEFDPRVVPPLFPGTASAPPSIYGPNAGRDRQRQFSVRRHDSATRPRQVFPTLR